MQTLTQRLDQFSALVSNAILQAVSALVTHDAALAQQVSAGDNELNVVRFGIEERTYAMLETHKLNERDVRVAVSAVMVSQALEHIGDNAANVAHLGLRLIRSGQNGYPSDVFEELTEMSRTAAEMVQESVTAFLNGDVRRAEATVRRDRELNDTYERISNDITPSIPSERRLLLLWAAHNLQQIGVYSSAICERAIFVATGEHKEFR